MRITLTRDVLLTGSQMGYSGESHTVTKDLGHHLVSQGFATEAEAAAAPADPATRETKPAKAPKETK